MNEYIKKSIETNTDINYIEIILKQKEKKETEENVELIVNNLNWNKEEFDKVLHNFVSNKENSYFKKNYDVYVYQNIEYHLYDEDKILVFTNNLKDVFNENTLVYNAYNRNSIPTHMFPSTKNIHDKLTITRITIKFSNRIYLNFEIQYKPNEENKYKIYINYNHTTKLDLNCNLIKIREVIEILGKLGSP